MPFAPAMNALPSGDDQLDPSAGQAPIEFELDPSDLAAGESPTFSLSPDGSTATMDGAATPTAADLQIPFDANLVAYLSEGGRARLVGDVTTLVEADDSARSDWLNTAQHGVRLMGLKFEKVTEPWEGASSTFHPMLVSAVTGFQSRAIKNLFPASGPAKAKVKGLVTPQKMQVANRITVDLNNMLTATSDYRSELEKALFNCGLMGSGFIKSWWSPSHNRPLSFSVAPEHLILSPDATDVTNAARITHVMRKHAHEIRELEVAGFYYDPTAEETGDISSSTTDSAGLAAAIRDLTTAAPGQNPIDPVSEEKSDISGVDISKDERHRLYEVQIRLNLRDIDPELAFEDDPNGVPLPYVVTIDTTTDELKGLRRNWDENDPQKKPLQHFAQYLYIVSDISPYGLGLVHLIGQCTEASTSMLRSLLDAGTLATMQAGFKARTLRIRDDGTPLRPGEFRDVDVPAGKVADSIYPLTFKEPSATLLNLLGNITDVANSLAAQPTSGLDDLPHNAASFAVLALVEREIEPQAAVFTRLHAALGLQLRQIAEIAALHMNPVYEYDIDGSAGGPPAAAPGQGAPGAMPPGAPPPPSRQADLSSFEVVPVSNPNEATSGLKMMKLQALLQLNQQLPGQLDQGKLTSAAILLLGEPEFQQLQVQPAPPPPPMDPVSEVMALMNGQPVQAYMEQDHDAHIKVIMNAFNDPMTQELIQNSGPAGQAKYAAMQSLVSQHMGFRYRQQIEQQLGRPLPPVGQPMPPQMEAQVAQAVAAASDAILQQAQAQQNAQAAQDPVVALQQAELALKNRQLDADIQDRQVGRSLENKKIEIDAASKGVQLAQQERQQQQDAANNALQHVSNITANVAKAAASAPKPGDKA